MNILKSFMYAAQGLWHCITTQRNFRFHIVAAVTVLAVSRFYSFDRFEMMCLAFAILFVMVCEMVNTAIESTVDMHGGEYNLNAKIAKDVAAGAVMLAAVLAVIIAVELFGDIETVLYMISYFIERPYLWIAAFVYVIAAVCFVAGLPFKNKEKNNGKNL